MMKKFIKILAILLLLTLTASGYLAVKGYIRFKDEIKALPLNEAVKRYTDDPDYVSFDQIDEDFVNAVVAVEDKRFFTRKGYDLIALCRALYHDVLARDLIEGGSTITEQIAKNLYMESYVSDLEEKVAEIFILLELEKDYSKEELFALYANMNYYGDGYWGIKEAAEGYYQADCSDLTLAQAAILAGIPNAPAIYQLSSGYEGAKGRQKWVMQTMYNNGYISEEEMQEALKENVRPKKK